MVNSQNTSPSINLEFVLVPETTLPNGTEVPSFKVGKYLSGLENEQLVINATSKPWVKINYYTPKPKQEKLGWR